MTVVAWRIVGIVASLLAGFTGGRYYIIDKLVAVSKEAEQHLQQLNERTSTLRAMEQQHNRLEQQYAALDRQHKDLQEKYDRAIRSTGSTVQTNYFDLSPIQLTMATGDRISMALESSDLLIRLVRVTDRGPIVRIENCDHVHCENDERASLSDYGRNAFLVRNGFGTLTMYASREVCEKGITLANVENTLVITVQCEGFDVARQSATMHFTRKYLSK